MGSKKRQKNQEKNKQQKNGQENREKQEKESISFLTEEVEEIKEIVERRPEQKEEQKSSKSRWTALKKKVQTVVSPLFAKVINWFGKVFKDVRSFGILAAIIGLSLLISVIILAVRLGGVSKELKSVQAMSLGLQEELTVAKQELLENEKMLLAKDAQVQEAIAAVVAVTATPVPTVTPLPTATPVVPKYVVCVDPGHGDWDGGAVYRDENGRTLRAEKDDNLRMSKWFKEALETYGVEVILTRETDVALKLEERTAIANNINADVLISFHRNSFDGENDVRGAEVWIHSSRPVGAKTLANSILDAIMEVGGMPDRGVKYGSMTSTKEDFEINRSAKMTSMIVELGFISSAADNEVYDANGKVYAEKMAKAVYEWLEAQEPADTNE